MKNEIRRGATLLVAMTLLSGCSGPKLAVSLTTPMLENTAAVALRSSDPELVEDAIPTSILLLEGMLETSPKNRKVAMLASMFSFAYGFAFVEPDDPERASRFYLRGRELAWRSLGKDETKAAVQDGTLAELAPALEKMSEKDAEALLWVAANWAMWIQGNLSDPSAAADLARLMPLVERVAELNDELWWGLPRILLGGLHAGRPVMLGGDPDQSKEEFERAFTISGRNMLLAQVFYAKFYCLQTFDQEEYESSLREVLDAPPGQLPDAELLNAIARIQAQELLTQTEEIFE